MDISGEIKRKAAELTLKAKNFSNINIKWEKCLVIKCQDLASVDELKSTNVLDVFEEYKERPAVYFFEVISDHKGPELVSALSSYKSKRLRSCPKIEKSRSKDSRYLYCGSVKSGLHGRFIQHVGFGSPNTYALQLFYWAKSMSLELNFYFAWLPPNYEEYTEMIESALADKLNPLVGKKV